MVGGCWTLRRARPALAPRPALRVPGARSANGASTTGRTATHYARSNPRIHWGALKLRLSQERGTNAAHGVLREGLLKPRQRSLPTKHVPVGRDVVSHSEHPG